MVRAALLVLVTAATVAGVAVAGAPQRPDGEPASCRYQSTAGFPENSRNLVVGPLVLVGAGDYSPPEVIEEFGGQKYPAVVLAGHRVTVELVGRARPTTSLLYADETRRLPDGPRIVRDGHRAVRFRACRAGRARSSYDGRPATFWSGFVLASVPRCVRLRVWVDDERASRHARIPLGRRCPAV